MVIAERRFLLPCPCSATVPVTAGQAGGRIACSSCGRTLDIPRLRDLVVHGAEPAGRTTSRPPRGRGLVVAGIAVAAVSAATAATLVPVGSMFFSRPAGPSEIRSAIARATPEEVQAAWQALAATGVNRPPSPEEQRLRRFASHAAGVANLLWGVAGIGVVLAVTGAALAVTGPPGSPGQPR